MSSSLLMLVLSGAPAPADATEPPATAAAPAAQRPTVHVVADQAYAQWLIVRLLEDGYPLTTAADVAQVRLEILPNPEGGWKVNATGQSTVSFEVEEAADPAVVRLELLHRSFDALEDVVPAERTESQPTAVHLDVGELPPTVAPQIAAGILAAEATLVPPGSEAQLRVCADESSGEDAPQISIVEGDCDGAGPSQSVDRERAILPATTRAVGAAMDTIDAAHLEAEAAAEVPPHDPAPVAPAVARDPERAPGLEARTPADDGPAGPFMLRGGAAGGVFGRGAAVDALASVWLTFGREPGLQAWLEVQARPTNVVGPFRVVEVFPAAGFKFRPWSIRRFSIEAGGLVGPEIHSYRLRASQASAQGNHVAVSAESALGFAFAVWKNHELHVALRVGGGVERIHHVDGQEIWRRRALRVGATVGFSFGMGVST